MSVVSNGIYAIEATWSMLLSIGIGGKVTEWRTRPWTQEVQEDKTHLFAQIANALERLCHNACFHSLPPLPHPAGTT